MIAEPDAIGRILKDANFSVHIYDFGDVAGRVGITFVHQNRLRAYLPVAVDGEAHRKLRPRFEQEISKNTGRALAAFDGHLAQAMSTLSEATTPARFCLVRDLLKPAIRSGNLALAGLDDCAVDDLESLPLFFDPSLSLRRRRYVEQLMASIFSSLPDVMPEDEKYFRIAILALNMSTVLGSVSESLYTIMRRNEGIKLKDMDWDPELPATALPIIKRRALADSTLCGNQIGAGDVAQLFLDVDGLNEQRGPRFSELHFAAGPHKCPGMNYSRKLWNILTRHMRTLDKRSRIVAAEYRSSDQIFNMLERLEVEFRA